jgi:hypothetical protein
MVSGWPRAKFLDVGRTVEADGGRADRRREVERAAVAADHEVASGKECRKLSERRLASEGGWRRRKPASDLVRQ